MLSDVLSTSVKFVKGCALLLFGEVTWLLHHNSTAAYSHTSLSLLDTYV
jgi:hypothetical protein